MRGLEAGAPVEYRGVQVGTVISPNLPYTDGKSALDEASIPVLIRVEPGRMGLSDDLPAVAAVRARVRELVHKRGLRASLKAGNLFTGSLYAESVGERLRMQYTRASPRKRHVADAAS